MEKSHCVFVAQCVLLSFLYSQHTLFKHDFKIENTTKIPHGRCLASQVRRVQDFCACVWLLLSQQYCPQAQLDETSAPKNPECQQFLLRILGRRSIREGGLCFVSMSLFDL